MDPGAKKEIVLPVHDNEIYPELDEEGHIRADNNNRPLSTGQKFDNSSELKAFSLA
jgi:hypothetical protein